MATKYLIREVVINERFARSPKVTWDRQKKIIYDIITDLSQCTLFKIGDLAKPNYNLVDNYGDNSSSLAVLPINTAPPTTIFDFKLLGTNGEEPTDTPVSNSNYTNKGFRCLFKLGLITHESITLFEEGQEKELWEFLEGDNAGELSKTAFGIIVSEHTHKIFIIKQSGTDTSGYQELLYYVNKKSLTFSGLARSNISFKLLPIFSLDGFDPENVASVSSLEIGVNSDLINEYTIRNGKQDAFYSIVIAPLSRLFGTGRTTKFEITFSEDGDQEAKDLFNELYSSFSSIQDEAVEKIFTDFKLVYQSINGEEIPINFKRNKIYSYQPEEGDDEFTSITKAFKWILERLNNNQRLLDGTDE